MTWVKCHDGSYCSEDRRVWVTPRPGPKGGAPVHRKEKDWTVRIDKLDVATVRAGVAGAKARAEQLFEFYQRESMKGVT